MMMGLLQAADLALCKERQHSLIVRLAAAQHAGSI